MNVQTLVTTALAPLSVRVVSDQAESRQFQQDDRIFDQSWNAGTRRPLKGLAELEKVAATNPYKTAHDLAHGDESFVRGMK